MSFIRNIAARTSRPIGATTLGRLLSALGGFLLIVLAFGYIADEVTDGNTQGIDIHVLQAIHAISTPALTQIINVVTFFGSVTMVLLVTMYLVTYLVYLRRWRAAVFTAFAMGGTLVTFTLLKLFFERERPVLYNLITESTYSFPSGHASLSCALALTVIVLTWHTKWRKLAVACGVAYVTIIGFSRLYLTVHYPTDVVAGWLVAASWVLVVATIMGTVRWSELRKLTDRR